MTTKAAKTAAPFLPYRHLLPKEFVYPDPSDSDYWLRDMLQAPVIAEADYLLRHHFDAANRPDLFIDSGGFVFYNLEDTNRRVRPDLYLAFGVDAAAILARNGYSIPEVGKPPDFALEIASPSTHGEDTGNKRRLYRSLGVGEYWMLDVTGGDHYGFALAADRLIDGASQPIEITAEPDGTIWGHSPTLNLSLCWQNRRLRFYHRPTARYLPGLAEETSSHRQTQAALAAERAARGESEAEAARLRAELRRLRGG